jgi:hypothetical protein
MPQSYDFSITHSYDEYDEHHLERADRLIEALLTKGPSDDVLVAELSGLDETAKTQVLKASRAIAVNATARLESVSRYVQEVAGDS